MFFKIKNVSHKSIVKIEDHNFFIETSIIERDALNIFSIVGMM